MLDVFKLQSMKPSILDDVNLSAYTDGMNRLTDQDLTTVLHPVRDTLARFVTAYLTDFGDAAGRHGLTPTQAKVVLLLENGDALSMRTIAERLFCDPSNITGVADRMEAHGLVRREVSPSDRRVKNVVATEAGLTLARQIRAEQHRTVDALSLLDPGELTALHTLLAKMLPTLEG
jgi:DNA-binding MarR family transcriptional regulator